MKRLLFLLLSLLAPAIAGAQTPGTYEYTINVTDNLKARIEYTMKGRFTIVQDERHLFHVSSEGNTIEWEPGLDSLKVDPAFKDDDPQMGVDLVFGVLAEEEENPAKVLGDMAKGVGQMVGGVMKMVSGRISEAKPEYVPPMLVHLPIKEGTFEFRLGFNEKGMPEMSKEKIRALEFYISANMEKLLSMAPYAPAKILKGEAPYISGTATITVIENQ